MYKVFCLIRNSRTEHCNKQETEKTSEKQGDECTDKFT